MSGDARAGAEHDRPAPLGSLLVVTFFASIAGGASWAGTFFVTAGHFHFSPARNLALAAAMGLTYAACARYTGALLRVLEAHFAPRSILAATLTTWGLSGVAPLLARDNEFLFWAAALVSSVASAITWPVVESFLGAGRHGATMRAALGWFNVIWTPATALPLLLLPLLARWDLLYTLALALPMNAIALVALWWLPARPGRHAPEVAASAVGAHYVALREAASWLLPLAYVMSATLSPILPYLLGRMGSTVPTSVVAATWMIARFVTLGVMAFAQFWHGRWVTLLAAGLALAGGLGLVFLAESLPAVVAGLLLFGAGTALTYYTAIYYSLAVGHAEVDASGGFEALIGLGYGMGPALGLLAERLAGGAEAESRQLTVIFTWVVAAGFFARAARPWLRVRASR